MSTLVSCSSLTEGQLDERSSVHPQHDAVDTPHDHRVKGKKRTGIRVFFRRTWKAVKRPFLRDHSTKVVPIVPPLLPDDPDLTSVPSSSGLKPRPDGGESPPVRLCWLEQTDTGSDSGHCVKAKKHTGIRGFFKKTWKAVKHPSLHGSITQVQPIVPSLLPDTRPSEPDLLSTASSPEPDLTSVSSSCEADPMSVVSHSDPSWLDQTSCMDSTSSESLVSSLSCFEPTDGDYDSYYIEGLMLGSGCFGMVHEGTRISDGTKVAIKFLSKSEDDSYLVIPGHSKPLLTEVALMLMMRQDPESSSVIKMLEWFEDPHNITIIMEYPHPCQTLEEYISYHEILTESMARHLMVQAVQAVQQCIEHEVFHTDIHPANILINTNTLELKLIDFSCGQLFTPAGYLKDDYRGASAYCPPEILSKPTFHGIPANVWHLGLLLYEMVNGCLPFADSDVLLFENPYVSQECRSVVRMCLDDDPAYRPTLEEILQHKWFSGIGSFRRC